jgi:anti-sigma regulatory factor (Ser/Thr protein kinase)
MPAAPITAIGTQWASRSGPGPTSGPLSDAASGPLSDAVSGTVSGTVSAAVSGVQGGPMGAHAAPGTAQSRSFARRAEEVPVARRFVREALADHPGSTDAELLACELVTNAVQHAADAAAVTVTVTRFGQFVHVDVTDDGKAGLPHWREANGHDESGRGFQLVNELAHRWGFLREPAGTCVWFEIA